VQAFSTPRRRNPGFSAHAGGVVPQSASQSLGSGYHLHAQVLLQQHARGVTMFQKTAAAAASVAASGQPCRADYCAASNLTCLFNLRLVETSRS